MTGETMRELGIMYDEICQDVQKAVEPYYLKLKAESDTLLELEEKIERLSFFHRYKGAPIGKVIKHSMGELLEEDKSNLPLR